MANPKKRLNKQAKAAQKILAASKLLASTKTTGDSRMGEHFKPADVMRRPSPAIKSRPQKKRG